MRPVAQESYDFRKVQYDQKVKLAEERGEDKPAEPQKTIDEMTRQEKAEFLGKQEISMADRPRAIVGGYKHARAVTETADGLRVEPARINVADDPGFLPSQGLDLAKQAETLQAEDKEPGEPSPEVKAAQERAEESEKREETYTDKLSSEAKALGSVNSGVFGQTSLAEKQEEPEPAKTQEKKSVVQKAKEVFSGDDKKKTDKSDK